MRVQVWPQTAANMSPSCHPPSAGRPAAAASLHHSRLGRSDGIHAAMPVQNKDLDFFIISEPTWLDEKYSSLAKQVRRPCAALVSTDQMWIT